MARPWLHNPVLRVQLRSLDLERALELDELSAPNEPSLLLEVTKLFMDVSPSLIDELKRALDANARETVNSTAHALKSSSANIGAPRLSQMCAELERKSAPTSATPLSILKMNFFELNLEFEALINEIRILHRLAE